MEKEHQQQDSLATVAVKDYAPSESAFSCEPPPAYQKPMRSTAVQVARIAAVTLVLMSFILGSFILAASWIQAARSCELQLQLQEDFSRQQEDQPGYQALVSDPLQSEESMAHKKLAAVDQRLDAEPQQQESEQQQPGQQQEQDQDQDQEQDEPSAEQPSDEDGADRDQQLHFKLPLTLDFDDLAGSLVERNLRARMDCVVEKRRLDQTVAQPARELRLPFGLNVSTAPRLEHSTGERLAISCETGRDQRHMPAMEVMGPVVVPLPGPVQLPLQFHGAHIQPQPQHRPRPQPQPQPQPEEQAVPLHILEALRVPIQVAELQQGPAEMQRIPIQITEVHEIPEVQLRQGPGRIPPQVVAEMRAAVQMAAAEAAAAAARRTPQPQRPVPGSEAQLRAHLEAQAQAQAHAQAQAQAQQARRMPPQLQLAEAHQVPMHMFEAQQIPVQVAEGQVFEAHHVPMQMAEEAEARSAQETGGMPLEAMQMPYQRLVPPPPQPQPHQGPARPHYVHPRSVRSVDQVFHKRDKRVRRCACDCAC
ncbi:uncharacterized protein LOC126355954 [Schistocerca gregaria]|uniref:uncharacterized protein LOC126355954 n=1 Tax=Schistocerca gregaria TaxID=7010 RepID=UPI00211F2D9D|nr:uncharacterized protein LOC126355954 [Schistocerca gregaria]